MKTQRPRREASSRRLHATFSVLTGRTIYRKRWLIAICFERDVDIAFWDSCTAPSLSSEEHGVGERNANLSEVKSEVVRPGQTHNQRASGKILKP